MPTNNGSRVTQRELYDALIGVETRLGGKIDGLATEIRGQNVQQGEAIARICATEEEREKRVDNLDRRDRLGTIVSGIGIAIGTALGIIVAPKQ